MRLPSQIWDSSINFLFPKSRRTKELEAFSSATLLETLPSAKRLKEKHALAIFDYSHPLVKEIIWELKYGGNVRIADQLGEILYDVIQHELADLTLFESARWRIQKPILIPIPISDKRRFERGWNQSELLAKRVVARDSQKTLTYLPRQLVKIRETASQVKTRSRNERLKNLTNSMQVRETSSVSGACVIVLDDVTTTGSTFAEAKRALYASGARKILCLAVAH